MGEYIIYWDGIGATLSDMLRDRVPLALWAKRIRQERLRESIVRCRDCKHANADCSVCYRYGEIGDDLYYPSIEPEGFCAWARRKEGGDD